MLFGRRQGRAVKAYKQKLLEELLPKIRLSIRDEAEITCETPFDQYKSAFLEIGFGDGTHLVNLAKLHPETLIIGCEPFVNGVGSCLAKIKEEGIENIRLYDQAIQTILPLFGTDFFEKIYLLFPDPWPKKRHFKRRIVTNENMALFLSRLQKKGVFLFATDHEGYREWALDVFSGLKGVERSYEGFSPPGGWVETAFQKKGEQAGRAAYFVSLTKE